MMEHSFDLKAFIELQASLNTTVGAADTMDSLTTEVKLVVEVIRTGVDIHA